MLAIGYDGKFYNLWDITEKYKYVGYNRQKVKVYKYLKHISTDINKTKILYPGVKIVAYENYNDNESYEEVIEEINIGNIFPIGKYQNKLISECNDVEYLIDFFFDNYKTNKYNITISNIIQRLLELGYKVLTIDGNTYVYTLEEYQNIIEFNKVLHKAENNEVFEFVSPIEISKDIEENIYYVRINNVKYIFPNKENILNKQIIITKYKYTKDKDIDNLLDIYIKEYKIEDRT